MQIFILTAFETNHKKEIGYFRRIYESSLLHKFVRVFIFTFQYMSMPVFTSVGIKLLITDAGLDDTFGTSIGIVILILVPIIYLVG